MRVPLLTGIAEGSAGEKGYICMANMGFISSRFAGNDGVSLESDKWVEVLKDYGHRSFWFAGKLDRPPDESMLLPEAFFEHSRNVWINQRIWGRRTRGKGTTQRIQTLTRRIKNALYSFAGDFNIDFLIIENALTIPMHIPLGIAITEFLSETGIPAISHNHDFHWERSRYLVNAVQDYLDMAFPPSLTNIQHVVINSAGRNQLAWRKGLASLLIPNVLDFENPARYATRRPVDIRAAIGVAPDDIVILQPTRVVPRKGIEHAISLVARLKNPRCKLVVTHESGDEGGAYMEGLRELAEEADVNLLFVHARLDGESEEGEKGREEVYSLWDVYPCADLVTYPSLYEGFGNAFLEAVLFRKPLMVNRYSIWISDIEPKGFKVVSMDGYVTNDIVSQVQHILENKRAREHMTDHNYELAARHYSYSVLSQALKTLITNITGLASP